MQPRRFIRDVLGLAGSQYVGRLAMLLRGIIAARLLGPGIYGAWNALLLLIEYGTLTHLGTLQGLDQSVPGRIVDGDRGRLDRMARAGLFNIVILMLLFSAVTLAYFANSAGQIRTAWGLKGVALALVASLLTNLGYYHTTLLRSHNRMGAVSTWLFLQWALGALAGLALLPWLGAWGLLWGWLVGSVMAFGYVRWQGRDLVPMFPVPSADARLLFTVGLPMFLYHGVNLVMRTLDRIIILRYLSTESLGYYSVAVMALGLLLYLPDSVSYVLYPQLLRRFREAQEDPAALRTIVERSLRVVALVLPALCGVAYLVADNAVLLVLPQFGAGVPALRILCFAAAALGLANIGSIVLMTLQRQWVLLPVAVATATLSAALMIAVIQAGFGIRGVAWTSLGTYAIHGALLLTITYRALMGGLRGALPAVLREFLPIAVAIPLAYLANTYIPVPREFGIELVARVLASVAAFLAAYALAVLPLARGIGLRQLAIELPLPFLSRFRPAGGAP